MDIKTGEAGSGDRGLDNLEHNRASTAESSGSIEGLLGRNKTSDDAKILDRPGWQSLFTFTTKTHAIILLVASLAGIASGAIDPVATIFLGRLFQAFTDFGGLGTADWLFSALFLFSWVIFGETQARAGREKLFDGLLKKPAAFYDTLPRGVAAMTPRLQTHLRELQMATSQPLGYVLSASTGAIASFVIALTYEWSLTLILLSTMPINALVLTLISSRMRNHIQNQINFLSVAAKNASNAFAAIETVKIFNGQDSEFKRFASAIKEAATYYIRQVRGNALEIGYMKCMTLLTFMIGFWYGSHLVISGKRTTADIITTFFSCLEVTSAIQNILPQIIVLEKGRGSGAVLRGVIGELSQGTDLGDGKRLWNCKGDITFQNVTFAYPSRPDNQVLKNVTCSIPAGKITFVIGRSGSGKSSLAQLLLNFYQPDSGNVLLDGCPLKDLDSHWLRSNITLVEQQNVLFEGTIFENIAAGKSQVDKVDLNDVKEAAQFALLLNTINDFPHGFDTRIGSKGNSLSGGQKQRMAIARARLRDTPVLIFDESTSALDQVSRSMVVLAIRKWRQSKTTVFITHDTSLIQDDDLVCLFEDGSMKRPCYYSALEGKCDTKALDLSAQKPDATTTSFRTSCQTYKGVPNRPSTSESESQDSALKSSFEYSSESKEPRRPPSALIPIMFGSPQILEPGIHSPIGFSPRLSSMWERPRLERSLAITQNALSSNPRISVDRKTSYAPGIWGGILHGANSDPEEVELDILQNTGESALRNRFNTTGGKDRKSRRVLENGPLESQYSISDGGERNEKAERPRSTNSKLSLWAILRTVWPTIDRTSRRVLVCAFICALVHAISIPLFSWIFSRLISTFYAESHAAENALKWSLSMLAMSLVDGTACYGMHICFESSAQAWIDAVRLEAMRRIVDQPKEFFEEERNSPSHLAYSLDRNAEEMRNILGRFVAFVSVAVIMMTAAITWCLVISWKLTLVGLALTPVSWGMTRAYQIVTERLEGRSNDAGESAAAILNEAFTNFKTVRALTLEQHFRKKHTKACERAFQVGIKRALYSGIFYGISEAIMVFNNSLIFFYGATLASSGVVSVQNMLTVFSQLLFALGNVTMIVAILPQVSSSKDTATRLFSLANLSLCSHEHAGKFRPSGIAEVALTDLSFNYAGRPDDIVLRKVNMKFRRGTTTALVGTSGSGKSTIASLLLKLYPLPVQTEAQTPMLSIDGRDIGKISTSKLRELITSVTQTPVLLPATVAENITYGGSTASTPRDIESIRAAASSADIHDFLMSLPNGYDTLIGDGGIGLSGGQAQRVAIARAIFRKPTVLILDEATSALDVESARTIHGTIKTLIRENPQMAVIIITHSRDMMLLADRIVVLDHGQVIDEGSFNELTSRGGKSNNLLNGVL